jgi:hypothetical protein
MFRPQTDEVACCLARFGYKEPPLASLFSAPRRSLSLVLLGAHALRPEPPSYLNYLLFLVLPYSSPPPSGPPLLIPPAQEAVKARIARKRRVGATLKPQVPLGLGRVPVPESGKLTPAGTALL